MIDTIISNPPLLAAIFTLLGGIAIKAMEKWLGRQAEQRSEKKDYREEINEQNQRIDKMQEQIDELRRNLYAAQEEAALLRVYIIEQGLPIPGTYPSP